MRGFWMGGLAGMALAVLVTAFATYGFGITGLPGVLIGFVSGVGFTSLGILIGSALDDGY